MKTFYNVYAKHFELYLKAHLLLSIFRQENLSMSMKLNAVERRSRELLLTQGAAMSGAAVALSGLSTRLEGLIDQLIASYNISIKDLEVGTIVNDSSSRDESGRLMS